MSHKPRPTLSEELVTLVLEKTITDHDRQQAASLVLDAVANALGGRVTEPSRMVQSWWQDLMPGAMPEDPGREAFVLGALTHSLEIDDLHRASVVHPGCVVVPAAWACARAIRADGTRFLDAVIRGFEVACRIGMAVGAEHYRIWHNTATCGPFGAAMAVGSMLGLDHQGLVNALGNAGTQSSGVWEFLDSGAMSKHLHAGRAAESGWMAASLAAQGFTGPATILEGRRGFFAATCPDGLPYRVLENPQAPWQVHDTSIKPWPSCRHTHPAIDAALELRAQWAAQTPDGAALDPMALKGIHVRTYQAAIDVTDRVNPTSAYEAKFSMQHCVAAALAADSLGFDAFEEATRKALAPWRARVSVMIDPTYEEAYPRAWGSTVSLILRDGARLDAQRTHAKGDPEASLSAEELAHKARMLLSHGGIPQPDMWIELLLRIGQAPALPDLRPLLLLDRPSMSQAS